jgi:uncharacterized protein YlxW (UPF0749 family)
MSESPKDLSVEILKKIYEQLKLQGGDIKTLGGDIKTLGADMKAVRVELKSHGAELVSIRDQLVHIRRDLMKRATVAEVTDLRKEVRALADRVTKVEKRVD